MTIIYHPDWDMSEKGKKDVERHHKKIDDAIRKSVKDVIAEESIITKKKGKKVRIPVRGLKDYKFIHGEKGKGKGKGDKSEGEGESEGIGQGKGKPGDIIGRRPKQGPGKGGEGKPGDKPGEDYIEAEIDIDYLIEIMFEDLGLPWIQEKTKAQQLVPSGWKFETVSKVGILPRLHKKRTILEAIKRNELYAREIVEELKCGYELALKALVQANGDIDDAIQLIKNNEVNEDVDPYIIIEDEDLRYKQIEQDFELHSNAVVIAAMDTSGSMTTDKKYLCRSLLFWLVEFLKKVYDYVDIKFIVHTTEAKLVDEDTFFYKGECHTDNHYILMHDGSIKDIKDIIIGDKVVSINKFGEKEIKPVTRVYSREVEDLLEIDLVGAGKLKCTPQHRYFVFNIDNGNIYEKKAVNIDINKEYLLMPNINLFEDDDEIDEMNYVIGFIFGDGYVKDRSINITDKDVRNLEYLKSILDRFNISNNIICGDRNRLWIYSKKFCDYIRTNYSGCCELSPKRYINNNISKLGNKNLALFLSGLFDAEGHVGEKSIQLTMSSKKIIKQIYNLLLRFGIVSSYTYQKPSYKSFGCVDGKIYHKLQIQGDNLIKFNKLIGFRSKQKNEALELLCNNRSKTSTKTRSPVVLFDKHIRDYINYTTTKLDGYNFFKYVPHRYFNTKILPRKYVERLLNDFKFIDDDNFVSAYSNSFNLVKINSIEPIKDKTKVYDLTIKDNSSYIIDGVYSHNSGGTFCWTAIDKAIYLIETEYPVEEWNVYCVYVSDGDDFDPQKTVRYIDELMKKRINMFAYTEVKPQYSSINHTINLMWGSQNTLINTIKKKWKFNCRVEDGAEFCRNDNLHMILSTIRNKNHVYPTLKHILFEKVK